MGLIDDIPYVQQLVNNLISSAVESIDGTMGRCVTTASGPDIPRESDLSSITMRSRL